MSAQRASETPSTPNSLARDLVASLRTVQLPGSPVTYANRAVLREMGLRWDPAGHRWHGTTTAEAVKTLREQLHLEVRIFGVLEGAPKGPAAPGPAAPRPALLPTAIPSVPIDHAPRPHAGSRTRLEPRIALPSLDDEPDDLHTSGRTFSLWETTSGLPDDSREEDERAEARCLRDLRGRVKRARAIVAATAGLVETLRNDRKRAAHFYARLGVSEELLRHGVLARCDNLDEGDVLTARDAT